MNNFFENVYKNASENLDKIPWATFDANEYLQDFFKNKEKVTNKKALVIGCGLGDDAQFLTKMGYIVDAIDISPTSIKLAKQRFDNKNINFSVEDIFELPSNMINNYDFVYEGLTIQSIDPKHRIQLIEIISSLNNDNGELLLYTNYQEDIDTFGGPPWPLYKRDLALFLDYDYKLEDYKEEYETKNIAPYKCVCHFIKSK